MKTIDELAGSADPAIGVVLGWIRASTLEVEMLPPSELRRQVLLEVQVSTRSVLGAVAYETGGLLIDGGWLRLLGSGHPRLIRTLSGWNVGRSSGFYLVGDDAIGGFLP